MKVWDKIFHHSRPVKSVATQVSQVIVGVIEEHRLLGEILLQLPRQFDDQQTAAAGLGWVDDQLALIINPTAFGKLRSDDAQSLLAHEALHVLWQHPLRYAHHPHAQLVKVATDMAVNQYLPSPPSGTATLEQVRKLLRRRIPARLDSQDYLQLLEHLSIEERERLTRGGIKLDKKQRGQHPEAGEQDSHRGWQMDSSYLNGSQQVRLAAILQVLRHAWQQTPQRDRGLLPGEVRQALNARPPAGRFDWRRVLSRQVGLIARGRRETHARFNRRQPLRMELAGQVARQTADLRIFVDNSGSMTDQEISRALTEIGRLARSYHVEATVYSFDAKVYSPGYRLHRGQQLKWQRQGGGGTSFQAIFDYLAEQHVSRTGTIIIIITDGWGEQRLRTHRFQNVDWLLTTTTGQLSVTGHPGRVFELKRH